MSERDIKQNIQILRNLAPQTFSDGVVDDNREQAALLLNVVCSLIERFLLDINRIADAVEAIYSLRNEGDRR